jgi:PKD repeat protein
VGVEYTYTVDPVQDPNGDDVFYLFYWGDGTDSGWVNVPHASHAWTAVGNYSMKVKAKDSYGALSAWSESLLVQIVPLLVGDADGPYSGVIGEIIHFDGSISGGAPPYMYHWDFGDGNTSNVLDPDHTYTAPGVYTVTFTVTDAVGTVSDTTTATITTAAEPKLEIRDVKGMLGKVSAVIKNVGSVNASNVHGLSQSRAGYSRRSIY